MLKQQYSVATITFVIVAVVVCSAVAICSVAAVIFVVV